MNELKYVKYTQLEPWEGLNSRKFFDPEKGAELRSSIREHGVQETLIVAADESKPDHYRVIAGERRLRETRELLQSLKKEIEAATDVAAVQKLKSLVESRMQLPCAVIPPEKIDSALELNLVENLCRADITPLEEAEGYERLRLSVNGVTGKPHTIEEVATKVGKDAVYVRRRLKLRMAPSILLDAVNGGRVGATIAEIVGRIPDKASRERCALLILKPQAPAPEQEVPLNFAQAQQLIREHFMVSLEKGCGFDPEAADLVPVMLEENARVGGGSCKDCPMRSGNIKDLDAELSVGNEGGKGKTAGVNPNVCTNPGCFSKKCDAAWQITRKAAEAKGQKVIDGDAAREVFGGYQGQIAYDSTYRAVTDRARGGVVGYGTQAENMPFEKLFQGVKVETVVARNPHDGKTLHLVDVKKAVAAAKKAKPELFQPIVRSSAASAKPKEKTAEELKRERAAKVEEKACELIFDAVLDKLRASRPGDAKVGRFMLDALVDSYDNYSEKPLVVEVLLGLRDEDNKYVPEEKFVAAFSKQLNSDLKQDPNAWWRWMATLMAGGVFERMEHGETAKTSRAVVAMTQALGVDMKKAYEQAESAIAAAEKPKEKVEPPKKEEEKPAAKKAAKKAVKTAAKKAAAKKVAAKKK